MNAKYGWPWASAHFEIWRTMENRHFFYEFPSMQSKESGNVFDGRIFFLVSQIFNSIFPQKFSQKMRAWYSIGASALCRRTETKRENKQILTHHKWRCSLQMKQVDEVLRTDEWKRKYMETTMMMMKGEKKYVKFSTSKRSRENGKWSIGIPESRKCSDNVRKPSEPCVHFVWFAGTDVNHKREY